jgi:hypothetical protein
MAKAVATPPLTEMERALIDMLNPIVSAVGGTFAGDGAIDEMTDTLVELPEPLLLRLTALIQYDAWGVAIALAVARPDVFQRWLRVVRADTRPGLGYFRYIRERAEDDGAMNEGTALVRQEVAACIAENAA